MNGWISRIQRYSTKDGPGVRSTVFTLGCNLRCRWCSNPELIAPGPKILYHRERCVKCGACVALSGGAIRLGEDGCVIDREACKNLAECAEACLYDAYAFLGYEISAEDLAEKLLRDEVFYRQSGGGVTFSGGEAGLQDDFVRETAAILQGRGIHTALDTAGLLPWERLERLCRNMDLVLYDIKAMNGAAHREYTGVGNREILNNARRIAEMGVPMFIRLILVPGVNDQPGEIQGRLEWVRALGDAVRQVDILPYHRLGEGKYRSLGLPYPMANTPECPQSAVEYAVKTARALGLTATVGG